MLESKQRQIADAEKLPIPTVQAIIDGKLTGALSSRTLAVISPIDGKTIAAIPDCETADVDRAVAAARRAFEARRWQGMSPKQRKRMLLDWADRIASEALRLAALESRDMGMPIRLAEEWRSISRSTACAGTARRPTSSTTSLRISTTPSPP